MNRNDCDIARDLMPLSVDGVCSEGSQRFLDNHVAQCPPCRDTFAQMKAGMPTLHPEPDQEAAALKQGLRYLGKRFKALWITIAALVCALVLLLTAAGINQIVLNWVTDVPLDMCATTIGSTNALVYITASFPFLEQYYNGHQLEMEIARDAANHTGYPEAVILTYTMSYFPNQAKDFPNQFPDYRYTTSLTDFELCRDGNNIYLVDGMEGITTTDGDHLMLLDQGLPVSEIRVKAGKYGEVIYTWGDGFNIKPEELTENGLPLSNIMLRKDYEALQNTQ